MASASHHSGPPPITITPRQSLDPSIRRHTYGKIVPLPENQTWWERLFRR